MRIPFHSKFDEILRGDRPAWTKVIGSGSATAFVVGICAVRSSRNPNGLQLATGSWVAVVLASAVLGSFLGLLLVVKDSVERRIEHGQSVNLLLRIYFGGGGRSLVAWVATIFFLPPVRLPRGRPDRANFRKTLIAMRLRREPGGGARSDLPGRSTRRISETP